MGFTFVDHGGPPCVLYSVITGPFLPQPRVAQWIKVPFHISPACAPVTCYATKTTHL